MRELQAWAKYEKAIELKVVLEQNFLCYEVSDPVPKQNHEYLSKHYRELHNVDKEEPIESCRLLHGKTKN